MTTLADNSNNNVDGSNNDGKCRRSELRSNLRMSIHSKKATMTTSELQFLQDLVDDENLAEEELAKANETLRCDRLFFSVGGGENKNKNENENKSSSSPLVSSPTSTSPPPPCGFEGSQRRRDLLEARKKLAAEQAKKRTATLLWKKASAAARMVARLQTKKALSSSAPNLGAVAEGSNDDSDDDDDATGSEDDDEEETASEEEEEEDETEAAAYRSKPVNLRRASVNDYGGEGFEICDIDIDDLLGTVCEEEEEEEDEEKKEENDNDDDDENKNKKQDPRTLAARPGMGLRQASVNVYGGSGFEVAAEELFDSIYETDGSKKLFEVYDPWLYQEMDEQGRDRTSVFRVLGTSHDDHDCHPHVLSPIQMDRLQAHLPNAKRGESFWLKYSLVRDGSSPLSFLRQVRASPHTLLAMETIDGEVFGGFFSESWTVRPGYFGSGETFLWRMKHRRQVQLQLLPGKDDAGAGAGESKSKSSLSEQIEKEADLEVFKAEIYLGNDMYQTCSTETIAAGGGAASEARDFGAERGGIHPPTRIGFGFALGSSSSGASLVEGSSSACLTYRSPPLASAETFELVNLEAWGFTPCGTEAEARVLEYKNMFFRRHASAPF